MTTKLTTKQIDSLADAAILLNSKQQTGYNQYKITPMVLVPTRNCLTPYLTIPEGFYALVTSYDRYIGMWKPGLHFAKPWERVSHLVTQQYVVYDAPVKECPTADDVFVEIDVCVVLHIKDGQDSVRDFVFKLGPERLESMLKAYQEEAVRSMARQKKYSNIYDLMDLDEPGPNLPQPKKEISQSATTPTMPTHGIEMTSSKQTAAFTKLEEKEHHDGDLSEVNEQLANIKRVMNEKLNEYGVQVYSITITNVHLPDQFRKQMEDATTFDSKNKKAAAEQKYNLMVIDDNEKRSEANQRMNEAKKEAMAENEQKMATEMRQTALFEAETRAIIADIDEKLNGDSLDIRTSSELRVAQLTKAKELITAQLDAEANAESRTILSEMEAFINKAKAEARATVAKNNASTLLATAQAENIAASKLKQRRDFEAKMAHLRVIKNLASNSKLVLSGTNKDSVVAQLLATQQAGAMVGLNIGGPQAASAGRR